MCKTCTSVTEYLTAEGNGLIPRGWHRDLVFLRPDAIKRQSSWDRKRSEQKGIGKEVGRDQSGAGQIACGDVLNFLRRAQTAALVVPAKTGYIIRTGTEQGQITIRIESQYDPAR